MNHEEVEWSEISEKEIKILSSTLLNEQFAGLGELKFPGFMAIFYLMWPLRSEGFTGFALQFVKFTVLISKWFILFIGNIWF